MTSGDARHSAQVTVPIFAIPGKNLQIEDVGFNV